MRLNTCMWPCGCMAPPIRPKVATGRPSLVMKAGMMVWNGRFFGPTWLAWPAVVTKPEARFCSAMPVPGTTMPEPKPV